MTRWCDLVYATVVLDATGSRQGIRIVRLAPDGGAVVAREFELPSVLPTTHGDPPRLSVRDGVVYVWRNVFDEELRVWTAVVAAYDPRADDLRVSEVTLSGIANSVAFGLGGAVYAALERPPAIVTIDGSDPSALIVVDRLDFPELDVQPPYAGLGMYGVAVRQNAVYAGTSDGLYVFDAGSSGQLHQVSIAPTAGGEITSTSDRGPLVVREFSGDVLVVEVRPPLAPRVKSRVTPPAELWASFAALIGGRLYVEWLGDSYDRREAALGGMYVYAAP